MSRNILTCPNVEIYNIFLDPDDRKISYHRKIYENNAAVDLGRTLLAQKIIIKAIGYFIVLQNLMYF